MANFSSGAAWIGMALLAAMPLLAAADPAELNPIRRQSTAAQASGEQRIIVKFRSPSSPQQQKQRAAALAQRASVHLKRSGSISSRLQIMQLDSAASADSPEQLLARLRADPQVEYAQISRRRVAHAIPDDVRYGGQWYLQGDHPSAVRAEEAWDVTTGSVVIAMLDTGVRFNHPDLGGRLLPGYDFVSEVQVANDGDARDEDASDPGDWVDETDKQQPGFEDCETGDSSWHGTRVAGIIGADTNNFEGIAGVTWGSPLLPVRVLGKCGGYDHDIIPAMRWAAGIPVNGVPDNSTPARIINMSLGAEGACSEAYRDVISELSARGVLVVSSAGNGTGHAVTEPANCPGVLAVAGLRHAGTKVGYSNIGPEIAISAPAGNCGTTIGPCLYSLDTTYDLGITTPQHPSYSDQLHANIGTSFSAPIVAAIAALARSVNDRLTPAQTILRLQQSATPFPVAGGFPTCQVPSPTTVDQIECNCTTSTCGAGMANAAAAVAAAQRPFVIVTANPSSASAGQTVNLIGSESFAANGRELASYQWTVLSSGGETPAIAGANLPEASFTAPSAGTIVLRLTVTDSAGAQDFADVTVTTPQAPRGGGGGGSLAFLDLLLLMTLAASGRLRPKLRIKQGRPISRC